jgi:predicted phage terminase large subunit-like protein
MSNHSQSEIDPRVIEAILRMDFYSFVQAVFPLVSPNGPMMKNWHLEAIAYALTRVLNGELRRLIITVPPRSLKSICASVAFPAFALGHNPCLRFICASYAENLAFAHARGCRDVMRSALYQRLFPHTKIVAGRDSQQEFATTEGGNRLSTSVGGTLTGRGGNFVIIDDPMKAQDTFSDSARETVREWFSNTLLSRLDNKVEDAIVLVMQRLHIDDLAGHLLDQGGWTHLNLPAIAETELEIPVGPGRVHRRKPGDILHPEREPKSVLDEAKSEMGSMSFAAQYQQEPVAEDGNLVRWSWFHFFDDPPYQTANDRIIVSWDTALSQKELASYSVAVVLQVRGGTVYVLDVIRERLEYPELRRTVISLHRKWRTACNSYSLLIEDKGSGMGLIQELKREHIHAIAIKPEGDKVMRMSNQTAHIESGAVWLPRRAPWLEEFRRELCAFPGGRYDDQVDAFSQALARAFAPRRQIVNYGVLGSY